MASRWDGRRVDAGQGAGRSPPGPPRASARVARRPGRDHAGRDPRRRAPRAAILRVWAWSPRLVAGGVAGIIPRGHTRAQGLRGPAMTPPYTAAAPSTARIVLNWYPTPG